MNAGTLLLLSNAAATLALAGLIWTVQLVHYPAFRYVAVDQFATFEAFHQRQISMAVVPLMLVELATALALLAYRPAPLPLWWATAGVALVFALWAATFLVQVPLHNTLTEGYDAGAIDQLVRSNWVRTVAWSLRAGIVVAGLWWVLHARSTVS